MQTSTSNMLAETWAIKRSIDRLGRRLLTGCRNGRTDTHASLVTSIVLALAFGTVSLAFAQSEPAEDTLVQLVYPTTLGPGQLATLTYRLFDAQTAAPVTDVVDSHERPMHLIAVRRDLQRFQHIHPQPTGAPGEYTVEVSFAEPGSYLLFDEFTRASGHTTVQKDEMIVNEPSGGPAGLTTDVSPKTLGAVRVSLTGADALRSGQEAVLTFHLDNPTTGQPVQDLQPYLGAPAHGIIISEDGATFAHTHGEAVGADDGGHASMPDMPGMPGMSHGPAGASYGPEIALRHTFETPGLYKVWGQFQTHEAEVITADFVVRVAQ